MKKLKKILQTGDKASIDRCGQQHRYHSRVDHEYPEIHFFRKTEKIIKRCKNLKKVQKYAKISHTSFDQRPLIHQEAYFLPCYVRQNQQKKLFLVLQFQTTSKQKSSILSPLLSITFPQGFQIITIIGHTTSGSGGKKTLKRYLKYEHTDGQTDRQTDISTYRKQRPESQCFEETPNYPLFVNKGGRDKPWW